MSASNLKTYTQLLPYLTDKAKAAVVELIGQGMDRDLAITLVEMSLPEEEVYELGPSD